MSSPVCPDRNPEIVRMVLHSVGDALHTNDSAATFSSLDLSEDRARDDRKRPPNFPPTPNRLFAHGRFILADFEIKILLRNSFVPGDNDAKARTFAPKVFAIKTRTARNSSSFRTRCLSLDRSHAERKTITRNCIKLQFCRPFRAWKYYGRLIQGVAHGLALPWAIFFQPYRLLIRVNSCQNLRVEKIRALKWKPFTSRRRW